jgi:hypothetical protein
VAGFVVAQRDEHGIPYATAPRSGQVRAGSTSGGTATSARPPDEAEGRDRPALRRAPVGENTVAQLMRELGLAARRGKRLKQTTRRGRGRCRVPDLIGRGFGTDRLNHKWTATAPRSPPTRASSTWTRFCTWVRGGSSGSAWRASRHQPGPSGFAGGGRGPWPQARPERDGHARRSGQ